MPTPPQPPRDGHPGRPPRRDDETSQKSPAKAPQSYGQSAPMPKADEPEIEGETRGPAHRIERVEEQHESVEELAGEPMREAGEDDNDSDEKPGA